MKLRLMILGLVLAVAGCGARGEVAKDQVLAQVDKLLGEVNVKKKEVEIAVRNMDAGLDKLKKGKIESEVRLSQTTEKLSELTAKTAKADQVLIRLRDHLKSDQRTEINGKTYKAAELKDMADRTISARKKLVTESEVLKSSEHRLKRVVASLEQREQDGRERVRTLKQHLEEIETKSVALKSMEDAANLSGPAERLDFEGVEKQVRDLSTKIDVELAFQDEKSQESDSADKSLETIIRETSTASDTLSEIDKLVGKN
jgi:chromosome segregation ATPase